MSLTELQCTEGIIIRAAAFSNYDQILTLFTPDQGILKLMYKGSKNKWQKYHPLMQVECVYKEKRSEIFACEEISAIQLYLPLRLQYAYLQVACDMLKAIEMSQMMGKSAPVLYQLLLFYLNKIHLVADPWVLATSFKAKVLRYEGLFQMEALEQDIRYFKQEEQELLEALCYCQSYQPLAQILLPTDFKAKVDTLFKVLLQR